MTSDPLFTTEEFRTRVARAQADMAECGLDALLLTTEPEVRYFSGFLTRFWESPTRPWFLVLPAGTAPIAVIPSIGQHLMGQSWLTDIRTWRSPDYDDDGVTLLADALREVVPPGGRIGLPSGGETHLRMPLSSWDALRHDLTDRTFGTDEGIVRRLRMVKSDAEIGYLRAACQIADRAFDQVPEIAKLGMPLSTIFRRFQMLCLEEDADWVPYLAGGAAPGGYGDVISPADDRPLARGDVLMLDTGLVRNGYFSDFDRNWSVGPPSDAVSDAHARLIEATQAAFDIARPGKTASDLYHAMDAVLTGGQGGGDAGRLGHGVGMQLTEPPSLIPQDDTVLAPGMVLTLEPGIDLSPGRLMVHEENIVILDTGAEWLSSPQPREIRVIA